MPCWLGLCLNFILDKCILYSILSRMTLVLTNVVQDVILEDGMENVVPILMTHEDPSRLSIIPSMSEDGSDNGQ